MKKREKKKKKCMRTHEMKYDDSYSYDAMASEDSHVEHEDLHVEQEETHYIEADSYVEQEEHQCSDADSYAEQGAYQYSEVDQESNEFIFIKDSCDIKVQTTDTQASVSLQVGLQLAIALVISITVGDSEKGRLITQKLLQQFDSDQSNKQRIIIENSKDVNITTTDTDLAVNIQVLLQVLVALVAKLDIL
ncbi:spore coat protein [Rossellomorea aquimaris]|nr:spore coat protein [Rossellomorea aquimaris]WRP05574.1 spore coat protein [Rossellomorea aquimaris]